MLKLIFAYSVYFIMELASIEDKLNIIDSKFRKGSKSYKAARYMIRQNRELPKEEQEALINELEISPKSLEYVVTKLRKLDIYQFDVDLEDYEPDIQEEEEAPIIEEMEMDEEIPKDNNYATIDDLNSFKEDINTNLKYLASVISGGVEPEEEEEFVNDRLIEIATPDEMSIGDPSLTRKSIWLKPKTQMYYDLARQGIFATYAGSNDASVLSGFDGNLSDFFNSIIDDYFVRNFNADIGILMRRYV